MSAESAWAACAAVQTYPRAPVTSPKIGASIWQGPHLRRSLARNQRCDTGSAAVRQFGQAGGLRSCRPCSGPRSAGCASSQRTRPRRSPQARASRFPQSWRQTTETSSLLLAPRRLAARQARARQAATAAQQQSSRRRRAAAQCKRAAQRRRCDAAAAAAAPRDEAAGSGAGPAWREMQSGGRFARARVPDWRTQQYRASW